jgi:outer membrane protein with beta-barrel domain
MLTRARLLLTGFVLVALAVTSRPAYADGVGVGAKVGPLFSSFSSDTLNFKTRTGLMGGIWFGGNRNGTVGVQGELMYAVKKSQDTAGNETDLHYLEIPILMRINFGSANRERAAGYIIAGPAFDVKLKAELNGIDIADQYEGLDLGVIAGAGVEITRFLVEARYNWGLRNVVKGNLATTTEIKTRTFAILFGVRFN